MRSTAWFPVFSVQAPLLSVVCATFRVLLERRYTSTYAALTGPLVLAMTNGQLDRTVVEAWLGARWQASVAMACAQ